MLDALASKVLLPAWDLYQGRRTSQYRAAIRSVLDADLATIRTFQLQRIRTICQHAYDTTKFYRDRFDKMGLRNFAELTWEEFAQIPVLTKSELREQGTALVSSNFKLAELRQSATGGTTSSPTPIYMDWESYHRRWAATFESDRRIGYCRGQRIAYLWGARQDFPERPTFKQRILGHFISRQRFLQTGILDDKTMLTYYDELRRWKPSFIQAYPTPLAIFADFLLRNKLTLRVPNISVTAEPLLPSQDELITAAFGTRPFNWYGARESGRIATECRYHAGMHINCYGNFVEVIDRDLVGEPQLGSIVITDLWNQGMPIIRYEIGDLGCITQDICQCGSASPRMTRLVGRTTDVFLNSKGQQIPGVAFTNRIIKNDSRIREMQFVQKDIGSFEVLVVPGTEWDEETANAEIRVKLNEFMNEPTSAYIRIVDEIPREASGKVRFCKSTLTTSHASFL